MKIVFTSAILLLGMLSLAQQTIVDTITHGGIERTFTLYVPAMYSSSVSTPLVFNFHGYGSNMTDQMGYGDFRDIADTANFIIVHPMGTFDGGGTSFFNAGWGGSVDDVGFTAALINSIASEYNINEDRVYSTGMSNGGFMSYYLACELSDRIAAIASVTGTFNVNQVNSCNVQRPMPVMEIHGTADPTVPYNGNSTMESTPNTVNYWVNYNNCDTGSVFTDVPNSNTTDNCSVEHFLYKNGDTGVEIELYKIIDGAHTWPGATFWGNVTNQDIDASFKIWEFFAKYDINGKIQSGGTGVEQVESAVTDVKVFPNPAKDFITVSWEDETVSSIRVINMLGVVVVNVKVENQTSAKVSTQALSEGVYFIEVSGKTVKLLITEK
ncbi:MAG: T9SS type A sorting domain-containing protein [Flavobacteriales bacterium]|nr:T9SS type A sorting domain-containing protein [Flavobacteriales bacterium]